MTKLDCNNCANFEKVHKNPVCDPCTFFTDGRTPTHWKAIQALAPIHGPTAPYTDTQRLNWMLTMMSLGDDPANVGDKRTAALAATILLGKQGRDAIDFAMEGSP